ncbi:hypothetical protein BGHDH14_bgh04860 [Blumeria hordei DH14]|uniref:Uncharacterized protein n=1 Tax=Blumeria graminis f. sp. hordei (strain DH14) TaxID=546991 RepID=N1J8I0_BLUG1|nr:hypothetical protein BGHDH14_bgh04860 [Blumeria hordei DH14]
MEWIPVFSTSGKVAGSRPTMPPLQVSDGQTRISSASVHGALTSSREAVLRVGNRARCLLPHPTASTAALATISLTPPFEVSLNTLWALFSPCCEGSAPSIPRQQVPIANDSSMPGQVTCQLYPIVGSFISIHVKANERVRLQGSMDRQRLIQRREEHWPLSALDQSFFVDVSIQKAYAESIQLPRGAQIIRLGPGKLARICVTSLEVLCIPAAPTTLANIYEMLDQAIPKPREYSNILGSYHEPAS